MWRIVNTNATVSHEIARMKFSNLNIFEENFSLASSNKNEIVSPPYYI